MDVLGSAHGWISMQDPYKWRWIDQGYGGLQHVCQQEDDAVVNN